MPSLLAAIVSFAIWSTFVADKADSSKTYQPDSKVLVLETEPLFFFFNMFEAGIQDGWWAGLWHRIED